MPSLLLLLFVTLAVAVPAAAAPPHHTPDGFRNNYPHAEKGFADFLRWRRNRLLDPPPVAAQALPAPVTPALDVLHANDGRVTVTFIGHSTLLLQVDGRNLLTDPQFSARASPLAFAGPARAQPPGVALASLPHIDAVLISHNHYDHLDEASLAQLCRQRAGPPLLLLPLGLADWAHRQLPHCAAGGIVELDWWQEERFGNLRLVFTPVQHWSQRTPFDRNRSLWGGWAVLAPDFRFWFSGDLGYSRDIGDVGERLGPFDLAAIAVGAYEPRWFMEAFHMNPDEAVRARQDLRARQAIGIHFGTFRGLTDEPLDQPARDLDEARRQHGIADADFVLLRHGETRRWQDGVLAPLRESRTD